jgi:hypothetical protein
MSAAVIFASNDTAFEERGAIAYAIADIEKG